MLYNAELNKIFGKKYYDIIVNYIELIQKLLYEYDTVIFMARKAYCFYKAIITANLINKTKCKILSSRAITFNNFDFINKKVAIVEDVVVEGRSLLEVTNLDNIRNISPEIFVLACPETFPDLVRDNYNYFNLNSHYAILSDRDLLELATLITNYITSQSIPYNVDTPIYKIDFNNIEDIINFFSSYSFTSITKLIKQNSNIEELIAHIDNTIFENFFSEEIYNKIIIKIRFYWNKQNNFIIANPILLFPELSIDLINTNYQKIFGSSFSDFVNVNNTLLSMKNKYKVLMYFYSKVIAERYLNNIFLKEKITKISSEEEIFTENINFNNSVFNTNMKELLPEYIPLINHFINDFELYNALGHSYDIIFMNYNFGTGYKFFNEYITLNDIEKIIINIFSNSRNVRLIASLMLDTFIDNGIIVPRIIMRCESIIRLFKFGEVARLTIRDFELFANLLHLYEESKDDFLDKIEVEKISVLFFKKYNNIFKQEITNEDNGSPSYRICYSKFGPRISTSKCPYSTSQVDTLSNKLKKYGLMNTHSSNKIDIPNFHNYQSREHKLKVSRFAMGLNLVRNTYENMIKKEPCDKIFSLINSFNRLLTLLSIGNNEKDKITSLIAEIHLIQKQEFHKKTYEIYKDITYRIKELETIIDGILSGIWKYTCYIDEELPVNLLQKFTSYSRSSSDIYIYTDILDDLIYQENLLNFKYLNKVGLLLYEVALLYYRACNYFKINIHNDFSRQPYKDLIPNKSFSIINNEYNIAFKKEYDYVINFFIKKLTNISILANRYTDEFLIYLHNNNFNCSKYQSCFAVFSLNHEQTNLNHSNLIKSYEFENIVIFPLEKSDKDKLLNKICDSIYNSTNAVNLRIVYFVSENPNISLMINTNGFQGTLFKEQLLKVVNNCKSFEPRTYPELIICSNDEYKELGNFSTNSYNFSFLKEQHLNNYKLRRYLLNKEDKKMQISNISHHGTGDIHVTESNVSIYNDQLFDSRILKELNSLQEKCTDSNTKSHINSAINNYNQKNESEFKKVLKWLGENAMDFIKSAGVATISALINNLKNT